jgi:hypothetical protein
VNKHEKALHAAREAMRKMAQLTKRTDFQATIKRTWIDAEKKIEEILREP